MIKNRLLLSIISCFCAVTMLAQNVLPYGTVVNVRLTSDIDSKQNSNATAVVFADVVHDGKLFIKAGTPVELQVIAKKAKGCGRPGELTIKTVSTQAIDGRAVPLSNSDYLVEGEGRQGLSVGLAVGGSCLLLLPMLACLAIKGRQAKVVSGTVIPNVIVSGEFSLAE